MVEGRAVAILDFEGPCDYREDTRVEVISDLKEEKMVNRPLRVFLVFTLACAVAAGAYAADNARLSDGTHSSVKASTTTVAAGTATRAVGTIQYDNDTPFNRSLTVNATVGNRFVAADPHSIASASFRLAQNYGGSVMMTLWDVNGPSASVLFRTIVTGIPNSPSTSSVFNASVAPPVVGHSGAFIGGIRNTAFTGYGCPSNSALGGTCDGVALTQGTSDPGFGFNAAYVQLTDGAFPPTQTIAAGTGSPISPAANAIFRVTGDNLPVELMGFTAE